MDAAIQALREGHDLTGKNGILTRLLNNSPKLSCRASWNRKNGSTRKTMKSLTGQFELSTPRDRAGTFEPQIVKNPQTHLTDELERKIIALFSLGASYQDIRTHIEDMQSPVKNHPTH